MFYCCYINVSKNDFFIKDATSENVDFLCLQVTLIMIFELIFLYVTQSEYRITTA